MSAEPVSAPDPDVQPLLPLQRSPRDHPPSGRPVVRAAVVGADALSREGLTALLRQCPDVDVLPEGSPDRGDLLVLVVDHLGPDTIRTVRAAREAAQRVVLVVADLDLDEAAQAVCAGAVGILRRQESTRSLLAQVVRAVASGEAVLPPDLLVALVDKPTGTADRPSRRLSVVGLDDREVSVLELLSQGSDTREIARRLCYSERTVKTVIQDITQRFGLRNRSHAVAYALRHGLI